MDKTKAGTSMIRPRGTRPPEVPAERHARARQPLPVRAISISDDHWPIVDKYWEAALMAFAKDWKPDTWIHAGDRYDAWSLSMHEKEPERWLEKGGRIQEEFDSAVENWQEICRISKHVHFLPGNHENRIARLIKANAGLLGLRAFGWHKLADIPEQVKIHPYGSILEVGGISWEHGDRIFGKFGGLHAAHKVLNTRYTHTIFGHTHRVETQYRTARDPATGRSRTFVAHNQGHGSDVSKQTYAGPFPNWQQGFTAIEWWTEAGRPRFSIHPIVVIDGRFAFGGKVYDGRKWQ